MNLLTANEARELTKCNISEKDLKESEEVAKAIRNATQKGEYSVTVYSGLRQYTENLLRKAGYNIKKDTDQDSYYSIISWNA